MRLPRRTDRAIGGTISPRELIFGVGIVVAFLVAAGIWMSTRKAEAAGAQSARNLMQWGIALNLYLLENQNVLPETGGEEVSKDAPAAWYNSLPGYLSLSPLSEMPAGVKPDPKVASIWVDPACRPAEFTEAGSYYFCYAMNRYLQPDPASGSYRIYELFDPGAVVFLTEVAGVRPGALPGDVVFRIRGKEPTANVLFCDGHVESVPRSLLGEGSHPERVSWLPFDGAPEPVAGK